MWAGMSLFNHVKSKQKKNSFYAETLNCQGWMRLIIDNSTTQECFVGLMSLNTHNTFVQWYTNYLPKLNIWKCNKFQQNKNNFTDSNSVIN